MRWMRWFFLVLGSALVTELVPKLSEVAPSVRLGTMEVSGRTRGGATGRHGSMFRVRVEHGVGRARGRRLDAGESHVSERDRKHVAALEKTWLQLWNEETRAGPGALNISSLFVRFGEAYRDLGLRGVTRVVYRQYPGQLDWGLGPHHLLGIWAVHQLKHWAVSDILDVFYANRDEAFGSSIHGAVWTWSLRHRAHVSGRSFWPVLLRDLGLESKMRFSHQLKELSLQDVPRSGTRGVPSRRDPDSRMAKVQPRDVATPAAHLADRSGCVPSVRPRDLREGPDGVARGRVRVGRLPFVFLVVRAAVWRGYSVVHALRRRAVWFRQRVLRHAQARLGEFKERPRGAATTARTKRPSLRVSTASRTGRPETPRSCATSPV